MTSLIRCQRRCIGISNLVWLRCHLGGIIVVVEHGVVKHRGGFTHLGQLGSHCCSDQFDVTARVMVCCCCDNGFDVEFNRDIRLWAFLKVVLLFVSCGTSSGVRSAFATAC